MTNFVRSTFLHELTKRYGILKKLPKSDSLFDVDNGKARLSCDTQETCPEQYLLRTAQG
jgi:hypothetical protein